VALLEKYKEDLSDNKYLIREGNRGNFRDNAANITGNAGAPIDFKIDPRFETHFNT